MTTNYADFVSGKLTRVPPTGIADAVSLPDSLFPHQIELTQWAIRRGRAAIFADTGLGKSRMEVEWANAIATHCDGRVLILAPLAVAEQTVKEGAAIDIEVQHCRDQSDMTAPIVVTNYERLHRFDPGEFCGVVLDESSCIKHHDSKTLRILISAFAETPFKLCATATPAPNDWTELATHAEFLGICTRSEMLSEYFTHDGGTTSVWRLKGHARKLFWRWVCEWGALVRRPSDLGFDDSAYILPALHLHEHISDAMPISEGMLFASEAKTLSERRNARRFSLQDRVNDCAAIVNADREPWIIWCDLNAEGYALRVAIPDAIEIQGANTIDEKEQRLADFASGKARVLVTKPSIAGFGLNWQHCARMAFVGVTDSFEAYYQAVRRCWRFGQRREVHVHLFASKGEGAVLANLKRKERETAAMAESLSAETRTAVCESVLGQKRHFTEYAPNEKILLPLFMRTSV
jgi:hypothetical protein